MGVVVWVEVIFDGYYEVFSGRRFFRRGCVLGVGMRVEVWVFGL